LRYTQVVRCCFSCPSPLFLCHSKEGVEQFAFGDAEQLPTSIQQLTSGSLRETTIKTDNNISKNAFNKKTDKMPLRNYKNIYIYIDEHSIVIETPGNTLAKENDPFFFLFSLSVYLCLCVSQRTVPSRTSSEACFFVVVVSYPAI